MTEFIESFATQQLLPPWEAERVQFWGFVVRMSERRMRNYLDAYFNGEYPDRAPFHYTPVPDAHYGLLAAARFGRVASLNPKTASRLKEASGLRDTNEAWDHLKHTEVYLTFPALRYPLSPDNLITGEPTLVWVEPFIFSDNDSVVFSSREIWGSDCYLGVIPDPPVGLPAHQLHLDLGMIGIKKFNPRSMSELISVLHIRTNGDSTVGLEEILKQKPDIQKFVSILAGSGAFAEGIPTGISPSPYAGGDELNNLKQFRDCYDMGAAIYRAIVASKTTHSQVKDINLFDASKVEVAFMWSDSIAELLTALFDAEYPNDTKPPAAHQKAAETGPVSPGQASWAGPPPDGFCEPPRPNPSQMDWDMASLALPVEFAFSFGSKARFDVVGTIHTYGQTPA